MQVPVKAADVKIIDEAGLFKVAAQVRQIRISMSSSGDSRC